MKLVQVKTLPATDTQGRRFSVSLGGGRRITVPYDYALDHDQNVIAAARELVAKLYPTPYDPVPHVVPDVGFLANQNFDVVRLDFSRGAENA